MNQRAFTRANVHATAVIRTDETTLSGPVGNFSLYGLYVDCEPTGRLTPQQSVDVEVTLRGCDSDLNLRFQGSVSHLEAEGVGIEIESLGVDAFVHWRNLLAYTLGDADNLEREFTKFLTRKRQAV